jgi:hypothetical protein
VEAAAVKRRHVATLDRSSKERERSFAVRTFVIAIALLAGGHARPGLCIGILRGGFFVRNIIDRGLDALAIAILVGAAAFVLYLHAA